MRVYRSNRLEELAAALAEIVSEPSGAVLEPETIVVQSRGMERWISMDLSARFGVWANGDFPFPRAIVERVLDAVVPDDGAAAFTRERMAWTLSAELPNRIDSPGFEAISGYLGDDRGLKRFQLAARIANAFDQYAVYRPDVVLGWERDGGGGWQGELWRALVERHGAAHVAARLQKFFARWRDLPALPEGLPPRLSVFGVSYLPPIYVQVLTALSRHAEVHLLSLAPCKEYSADVEPRRAIVSHVTASASDVGIDGLHLVEGNPLFASLGRLNRDFQRVIEESAHYVDDPEDRFRDPSTDTMLHTIQSDVLSLRERNRRNGDARPLAVDPTDASVAIHCSHSPTREVEILRDQLLSYFEEDPTLEARDVVVMTPQLEIYAPLIDAVFGVDRDAPEHIPYRIADRTARAENLAANAVLRVLEVLPGRLKASELLDLLQIAPVRDRFDISSNTLAEVRRLVHEAGIRWAVDARHRAETGQPEAEGNTWRFGLRRLLLGYATPGDEASVYRGTLPVPYIEGDTADVAGHLADFAETMFSIREALAHPRIPEAWANDLGALLERIVRTDDANAWQLDALRKTLATMSSNAREAGFDDDIDVGTVREILAEQFESDRTTHDFLAGGVTFCAMLPMRSIPFRVVVLLGMNDAEFPRTDRPISFDLIAAHPRVGDRSTRDEDRHLFLEALASARDRFVVSYVGRGTQDNAVYPPSVVVSGFQAVLAASFEYGSRTRGQLAFEFTSPATADDVTHEAVTSHPLQPFSPRYFDGQHEPRLFSYASDHARGAAALASRHLVEVRFHHTPLVAGSASLTVTVDELARFFENPARALVRRQLGIYLEDDPVLVEDREPIEPGPLESYAIGAAMLERLLAGQAAAEALAWLRAEGILPLGTPGAVEFSRLLPEVNGIASRTRELTFGGRKSAVDVDLELGNARLVGQLRDVFAGGQVRAQFARVKSKNEISAWVKHLALQCGAGPEHPKTTVLVGRAREGDGTMERVFHPIEPAEAGSLMRRLSELYVLGQRAPLCFFPIASRRFVDLISRQGDPAEVESRALWAARSAFGPKRDGVSDANDIYVRRLFAAVDPFAIDPVPFDENLDLGLPSFATMAREVLEPMLAHSEVVLR